MLKALRIAAMSVLLLSGWAVAAALAFTRAPVASARVEQAKPPQNGDCVATTSGPTAPTPEMEVYVRPHPPAFHTGRIVRFENYSVFTEGKIEKIRFKNGKEETIVDSEAVDWPKQRPAPIHR